MICATQIITLAAEASSAAAFRKLALLALSLILRDARRSQVFYAGCAN
jgi:hypothetical protein